MEAKQSLPLITVLGGASQSGIYILRIRVDEPLKIAFGRFKQGKRIAVPAGECVYLGSALGSKGAMTLGRRLVRHATRSDPQEPHPIRATMLDHFRAIGLGSGKVLPKTGKKLHWHVDYLLDCLSVELTHILVIRTETRLERRLGQFLEGDPATFIIQKGLGASDVRGNTHLLGVVGGEAWWEKTTSNIMNKFG
jgi:Uri superfamily endonuclease